MAFEATALPDRLFIVGPMAAGKSAVGKRLAARLGMPFFDSDAVVEQRTGVDIEYIFDREGEEGFRRRERAVIAELSEQRPVVLSTGGGAVLDPDNRRLLAQRGVVIYLSAGVDAQLSRTRCNTNRPLLRTGDPRATLIALAETRDPLYQGLADITVSTDGRTVEAVVSKLLRRLRTEAS
jgi:shikimate kinase